jgi:phosphatidate cytidylyltransferase
MAAEPSTTPEDPAAPPSVRLIGGRNLSSAIASGVLLAALFLGTLFWHPLAFTVVIAGFVLVAAVEVGMVLRREHIPIAVPPLLVGGAVTVFGAYRSGHAGQAVGVFVLFLATVVWLMADPHRKDVVRTLTLTVLVGVWTGFLASFGVLLITRPSEAPLVTLGVIGAAIFGDIGGYAFGVRFGKRRIAPSISPKKSVEGLLGGLFVSSLLAAIILPAAGDLFTPVTAIVLAVACVLAGLLGDLTESMIKRDLGVKDLGAMIPGHGGLLDRVDGILMAMPVGFFVVEVLV